MKSLGIKRILPVIVAAGMILAGCNEQELVDGITEINEAAAVGEEVESDEAQIADEEVESDETQTADDAKYPTTWDMAKYYEDESSFAKDAQALKAWIQELSQYSGKLIDAESIKAFYDLYWDEEARDTYGKMMTYVNMRMTVNPDDEENAKLDGLLTGLDTDFTQGTSFAHDEIFSIPTDERKKIFADELFDDMTYLKDTFMTNSDEHHSEDAISLMAGIKAVSGYGLKGYTSFSGSSFPYCNYTLSDDMIVTLTPSNRTYIVNSDEYGRDVKIDVNNKYYENLNRYRDIYAIFLEETIAHNKVMAEYDGYDSVKSYCLGKTECEEIYDKVMASSQNAIPYLQKEVSLKKEMLGVDKVYPFEMNAGILGGDAKVFEYDEAIDLIRRALMPLGDEYIKCFDEYVSGGNIYVSSDGRSHGVSYTNLDSVKQDPYIYLDFYGDFNDVLTLAHELGHAVNYCFSKDGALQREFKRNELVDEIPPAVNEILVLQYVRDNAVSKAEKIYYTERFLNDFDSSFIDQAIYARLEDAAVTSYEEKGTISGKELEEKELALKSEYYGDSYAAYSLWENIPHLHYGYYLYTYPASLEYALAIVQNLINEGSEGSAAYKEFLCMADENVPKMIKAAGVDPLDDAVYESAIDYYADTVLMYEELIKEN